MDSHSPRFRGFPFPDGVVVLDLFTGEAVFVPVNGSASSSMPATRGASARNWSRRTGLLRTGSCATGVRERSFWRRPKVDSLRTKERCESDPNSTAPIAGKPNPHGLFTGAILDALADRATDRDHDGNVQMSELIDATITRVTDLTKGKQTPWVVRREAFGDSVVTIAAK